MTQKKCKISNTGFQLPFNTLEIYLAPVVAFVVHHNTANFGMHAQMQKGSWLGYRKTES